MQIFKTHRDGWRSAAVLRPSAVVAGLMLTAVLATGCNRPPRDIGENWPAPGEARAGDAVILQQAQSGVLVDRTLYPSHFDVDVINSLGETKVRLLAGRTTPQTPRRLFVQPYGDEAAQQARLQSVKTLIERLGEGDALAIDVHPGIDPEASYPATDGLVAIEQQREWQPSERPAEQGKSKGSK